MIDSQKSLITSRVTADAAGMGVSAVAAPPEVSQLPKNSLRISRPSEVNLFPKA